MQSVCSNPGTTNISSCIYLKNFHFKLSETWKTSNRT
jgi:hypothetical protein